MNDIEELGERFDGWDDLSDGERSKIQLEAMNHRSFYHEPSFDDGESASGKDYWILTLIEDEVPPIPDDRDEPYRWYRVLRDPSAFDPSVLDGSSREYRFDKAEYNEMEGEVSDLYDIVETNSFESVDGVREFVVTWCEENDAELPDSLS